MVRDDSRLPPRFDGPGRFGHALLSPGHMNQVSAPTMPSRAPLDARLLDKIEIRLEQSIKFPYSKVFALLAYLVLEPGQQRRETLTDLLWPRRPTLWWKAIPAN